MNATNIFIQAALILAVIGVLYLVLVRPQQRRLQRHKMMLTNLQAGDKIATTGGLVGTVIGANGDGRNRERHQGDDHTGQDRRSPAEN